MPIERVQWDKQDLVTCDERGRATLGSEFADEQVFVYIARTPDPSEMGELSDAEEETAGKLVSWAIENVDDWLNPQPREGVVVDKYGERHEAPYRYDPESDEVVERDAE